MINTVNSDEKLINILLKYIDNNKIYIFKKYFFHKKQHNIFTI